ncbi:hypothetical protein ACFL1R_12320 [Candidatus Latescibacterota bacterium]
MNHESPKAINKAELARKLDAAGWGLFFIWIGIALLSNVGWGIGLLGMGIITLVAPAGSPEIFQAQTGKVLGCCRFAFCRGWCLGIN